MSPRLPPEWAPQSATLLAWPGADSDCAVNLPAVREVIARMAEILSAHEDVVLIAPDAESRAAIETHRRLTAASPRLRIVDCPTNDIWIRDFGPIATLAGGRRLFTDFRFDGWNGRHPAERDDRVTAALHDAGALGPGELVPDDHVLEGGSIDTNGDGAILTTRRCLLDNSRNPGTTAGDLEALFRRRFGTDTVHWLTAGELIGDDTDGHIDTLARFVAPDTVVYQGCDDESDAHHASLAIMADELSGLRDRHGHPYHLIPLPLPRPLHDPDDGRRMPAGYANFVVANSCVLVPAFGDPADTGAAVVLRRCFPDRGIVPVDCRPLIRHNGSLHCVAMHVPDTAADG